MITKELTTYKEFGNVIKISNGKTEMLITKDFGPRIIRYGFIGGENIMNDEIFSTIEKNEKIEKYYYKGAYWKNYGGHRLWVSPESMPETYYPDNEPYEFEFTENGVKITNAPQKENGVQLTFVIEYKNDDITVKHIIKNIGNAPKTFAAWALTVAAKGGIEIIPFNDNDTGLLHNRQISIWHYTDLRDERIYLGHKYATVLQDVNAKTNLKLGFNNNKGFAFYVVNNSTFKISYTPSQDLPYPDNNVSFETYSCKDFTEVETLSPLKTVAPNEEITHTETWQLFKTPCKFNPKDDNSIDEFVKKIK